MNNQLGSSKNGKRARFPKEARLLRRRDFLMMQAQGVRIHCRYCTLLVHPADEDRVRLGITITKRVHKHAVVRNTFKRRVREIFRTGVYSDSQDAKCDGRGGAYLVVIARPSVLTCTFDELRRDLESGWRKARSRLPNGGLRD